MRLCRVQRQLEIWIGFGLVMAWRNLMLPKYIYTVNQEGQQRLLFAIDMPSTHISINEVFQTLPNDSIISNSIAKSNSNTVFTSENSNSSEASNTEGGDGHNGTSSGVDTSLLTINSTIDDGINGSLVYQWRIPDDTGFGKSPLFLQYCNSWHGKKYARPSWKTFPRTRLQGTVVLNEDGRPRNEIQMLLNSLGILRQSDAGTGNWITSLYALRFILSSHSMPDPKPHGKKPNKNDFQLISVDAQESQDSTTLPWLSGYFDSDVTRKILEDYWAPHQVPKIGCDIQEDGWGSLPIMWMFPIFQDDFRRMAIYLVGSPKDNPDHPAHAFQRTAAFNQVSYQLPLNSSTNPLFPDVELDDVAIHFRCGDVMASKFSHFHFLKFSAYARRIDGNTTKSIGIVTQPFKDQTRLSDQIFGGHFRHRVCEGVVRGMQQFLQDAFPDARVSIRNDPTETVALAFARLIMAKQAFASPDSTFSVFPVLSSFGTGYHLRPQKKNTWLINNEEAFATKPMATQVIMDEPVTMNALTTRLLRQKNEKKAPYHILQWFLNDTYVLPPLPGGAAF